MYEFKIGADDKATLYRDLLSALEGLTAGEPDPIANMANAAALIWETLPDLNWAGFYRSVGGELVHGGGGHAFVRAITDGRRSGVSAEFIDEGPGIHDVRQALVDGWSSSGGLGLGLGGSRRLVDEFDLVSEPGRGTRVTVTKWAR